MSAPVNAATRWIVQGSSLNFRPLLPLATWECVVSRARSVIRLQHGSRIVKSDLRETIDLGAIPKTSWMPKTDGCIPTWQRAVVGVGDSAAARQVNDVRSLGRRPLGSLGVARGRGARWAKTSPDSWIRSLLPNRAGLPAPEISVALGPSSCRASPDRARQRQAVPAGRACFLCKCASGHWCCHMPCGLWSVFPWFGRFLVHATLPDADGGLEGLPGLQPCTLQGHVHPSSQRRRTRGGPSKKPGLKN